MNFPASISTAVSVGMTYDATNPLGGGGVCWGGGPCPGGATCDDFPATVDTVVCASNSDRSLDIVAPGAMITSTGMGGGTALMGGTSMAAPTITGMMALVLENDSTHTLDTLEYCLESSGVAIAADAGNGIARTRVDALAALTCAKAPAAAIQPALFSVRGPDITVAGPTPCKAAALLTLPGLTPCSRVAPTPDLSLGPATLGLDTAGPMSDELDAISYDELFISPLAPQFHFSVANGAVGVSCTAPDVFSEAAAGAGEADGDIFTDLAPPASPISGCIALFQDESVQGLNGGAGMPAILEDDIDALTEPYSAGLPTPCDLDGDTLFDDPCPPFSIAAGSVIAGFPDPNNVALGAANLLVQPGTPATGVMAGACPAGPGAVPCVAIPAASLGLHIAGDDLDDLCWFDNSGAFG